MRAGLFEILCQTESEKSVPAMESNGQIFEVEAIIGKRVRQGTKEFLIRWKGFKAEEASWEPESNLIGCQLLVKKFLQRTRTPSPARMRSKAIVKQRTSTPTVKEPFTKLRTRRSVGEELKVLHYKHGAPQSPATKRSHKVETAVIHEKKKEAVEPKEEKPRERKPRYRQVFLGWFMAITMFALIMLFLASLLPVVDHPSDQPTNTVNV